MRQRSCRLVWKGGPCQLPLYPHRTAPLTAVATSTISSPAYHGGGCRKCARGREVPTGSFLCCASRWQSTGSQPPPPSQTTTGTPTPAAAAAASGKTFVPVHPKLIEELQEVLVRYPNNKWVSIQDVYGQLSLTTRRTHVRPHKSLLHVLEKLTAFLRIHIDGSGTYVAKGDLPQSPPSLDTPQPAAACPTAVATPAMKLVVVSPPPNNNNSSTLDAPKMVDFYYDVGLTSIPPPPADFDAASSTLHAPKPTADGTVVALRDFVSYVPPFFAPLEEILVHMPGYTEEHFKEYFATKAMELVQIGPHKYMRLYGGYGKISLDGCEVAEETYRAFRPDPALVPFFVDAFHGVRDTWLPLPTLLSRVDPAVVARLPAQGPDAILFFAQMQHVFGFSVDQVGGTRCSVLLRPKGYGGLTSDTTPTPKSCNVVLRLLPQSDQIDVKDVERQLPAHIRTEMDTYYGGLLPFLHAHAQHFYVSEDESVVMLTSYYRRLVVASLPLEEQLQMAVDKRDKRRIRQLRRRIAFRDNPSHPFHDPDNLAREVAKLLPRRGFIPLKTFVKANLSDDLRSYLPLRLHSFFSSYPQYFQLFEYQKASSWMLSRPGQPLPRGVLRTDFSEADVVRLIAEYLQFRSGKAACGNIIINLPRGAQDFVRKRHGGLYYLVERYPQYFRLVLAQDIDNTVSSAVAHLIQVPPPAAVAEGEGEGEEQLQEDASAMTEESNDSRASPPQPPNGRFSSHHE